MSNNIADGYSRLSIALHWIAAVAIVVLFITHEAEDGSTAYAVHVGIGALVGIIVLWRALRRPARGFPAKPDQSPILNLVSSVVLWAMLAAIVVVFLTGYLLPWSLGRPIDVPGLFSIPSPLPPIGWLHELSKELHEIAGHAIVPLVLLHVAGAAKHALIDRDGILLRMVRPKPDGY